MEIGLITEVSPKSDRGFMFFKALCRTLVLFFIVALCEAGEPVFFDGKGNPITKKQYETMIRKQAEKKRLQKNKILKQLSSKKSQNSSSDKRNTKKRGAPSKIAKTPHKPKIKMEYDEFGRPLFDSEGNMISYQYIVAYKVCVKCDNFMPLDTREHEMLAPRCAATNRTVLLHKQVIDLALDDELRKAICRLSTCPARPFATTTS